MRLAGWQVFAMLLLGLGLGFPSEVQVLCVTHSLEGRKVGDVVQFGGGYARAGERRIMLDPCLASPAG